MQREHNLTLSNIIRHGDPTASPVCTGANGAISFADIVAGSGFGDDAFDFNDRSVLLATPDQLTSAIALIKLDGVARRVVLCLPDVSVRDVQAIAATAEVDVVVRTEDTSNVDLPGLRAVLARPIADATRSCPTGTRRTEWVLLTSGTSGTPKLVLHDLGSLIGAIKPSAKALPSTVWATFYDIRRYGGLQIFLRALLGGHSMILSHRDEPIGEHLIRLAQGGVSHISGTPSHWRRLLMSGLAGNIAPAYVRLSGEIADQSVLDALQAAFPKAGVSHAYASTEAGVGFNVIDGRAGFPAAMADAANDDVAMTIHDGSLRLRSSRTASRYLGETQPAIVGPDGFVDTGDLVELRGDRYHFVGRRGGIINVGGQKVHPEEIEAVINGHPAVHMSLVQGRRSPITGALVVADVVLKQQRRDASENPDALAEDILDRCRAALATYKVPTRLHFVAQLDVSASGKLVRSHV
ncbi:MAG: long-chain fatty acid--CoA ligase [Tardiphaga sp.]|nr:long-chain fatty acid--CoA ligase [Tardiphaga sp.]